MRIIKTDTNVRNLKTRPWISKKTKRAIMRKNRFIKRRRSRKNSTDYHIYRRIRNRVNKLRKHDRINYVTSRLRDNTNQNPNRLIWNLIGFMNNLKSHSANYPTGDKCKVANEFVRVFSEVS